MRKLALSLILVLALTLSAGCALFQAQTPKTETTPPTPPVTQNTTTPIVSGWGIPLPEGQAPILPSVADVVALVKPSVVAINTKIVALDLFNRPYAQEGAGSGWIISGDGIIITNNHVVQGADNISVTLEDGRTFPVDPKAVATDTLTDLAVRKISAENLPAVRVGDSAKLRVGDWVVAIGNSLGQGIRATVGIVSRRDVSLEVDQGQTLYGLIETDAAINPGNSGGPLVNMAGEVIGITSAKIAAAGVEGMGYAIGTDTALPIIKELVSKGYVVRPWLGVELRTVDQFTALANNLSVEKGVYIMRVSANSPAARAGLKAGDVIISMGGKEVAAVEELTRILIASQAGQNMEIAFWRNNVKNTTQVVLAESPPPG